MVKLVPADSESQKKADLAWDKARNALTEHIATHPPPATA
jgi:hypothetical protein